MLNFLIYGAYGYTGELITKYAAERGLKPILAGRNSAKIEALANRYNFEFRVFDLNDSASLDAALADVEFVLHCAGPFSLTSELMVKACLRNKRHYLDITGEISVFEAMAARDNSAKEAGVMIMPGVGFDVVPSDCLARHLKNRLPSATDLILAFYSTGRISHGTQATMTMNIGKGGAIRRNGKITSVPAAWKTRQINFGEAKKLCVTIPWGDVSTAFYSTGIPNIEVYTFISERRLTLLKLSRYLGRLLATRLVQNILQKQIPAGGPSEEERATGQIYLWGEVSDEAGNEVAARLQTPDGYTLTALTALKIAEEILAGNFCKGFQTPSKCYGADLILEVEGVNREDVWQTITA